MRFISVKGNPRIYLQVKIESHSYFVPVATVFAVAMSLIAFFISPVHESPDDYGICLPSPFRWGLPEFLSWILNCLVIGTIALTLFLINKTYNFIKTTQPVLIPIFLVAACSSPWFTESLNASTLLCLINVVSIGIIFSAYDRPNATQQLFCIGFLGSLGSMFQYAFIPMIFVYFTWTIFLKICRLKETIAFGLGLVCPYWIGLGFGLLSYHDFKLPSLTPFFGNEIDYTELLLLLLATGFAAVSSSFISLINGMKLYAGNARIYAMNLCIMVLGLASIICIFIDYDNMTAYVITLFMVMAVQFANICALWSPAEPMLITLVPVVIYLILFGFSVA